ncbi:MAG TPA: helix-turn-helix domain-containing protein [Marmoricola sp.]|nr:helix-turn-helix domain-containing protein [Marmoricola sp.]
MPPSPAADSRRKRRPYAARVPADVRREQLLDAALTVIVRDGYDAISIDAISREAGVTRPVVYGVYDGLGPLLGALLDRQQRRALAQLAAVIPAQPDLLDLEGVVVDAARRLIEQVRNDPMTWQPILLAPHNVPEQVRARIAADREGVVVRLTGLVELALLARGRSGPDAEVLAHALLAVLEHFGRILLVEPDRFDTDRLVDAVSGLLRALV